MGIWDKKEVQLTGLDRFYMDFISKLPKAMQARMAGLGMKPMVEPLPKRRNIPTTELVIENKGAHIVLGRDRPMGPEPNFPGYGPKGSTMAHSIDLCVGMNSAVEWGIVPETTPDAVLGGEFDPHAGATNLFNPNFVRDGARVYISNKADIDNYLNISDEIGPEAIGKSCVALKADNIRAVARETVKIISGMDDEYNSQGTKNGDCRGGVYLVKGNEVSDPGTKLQSMVRGDNLLECVTKLHDAIGTVLDWVSDINKTFIEFCNSYAVHQHVTTGPGGPTAPFDAPIGVVLAVPKAVKSLVEQGVTGSKNDAGLKLNYLSPMGKNYILSQWHKLN